MYSRQPSNSATTAVHGAIVAGLVGFLVWVTVLGGWRIGPIRTVLQTVPASDKVGHLVIYGSITFFAALMAKRPAHVRGVAVAVMLVGALDEYRQLGESGRAYTIGDLVANGIGVALGATLAAAILRRRARHSAAVPLDPVKDPVLPRPRQLEDANAG